MFRLVEKFVVAAAMFAISFIPKRVTAVRSSWQMSRAMFAGSGAETGNLANLIVGVILAIVAAVVGINMLPSVITAWVTVSNTTGLDSSAASLTDVGQIVAVVVGIIVAVAVILVVLRISEHAT